MQGAAAGALSNLSAIDGVVAELIAAGAIPPLVTLLGAQIPAIAQEKAAGTLWSIACDAEGKTKAIATGAIAPLTRLAESSPDADVREMAARALAELLNRRRRRSPSPGP